jgi:hypothetical protein
VFLFILQAGALDNDPLAPHGFVEGLGMCCLIPDIILVRWFLYKLFIGLSVLSAGSCMLFSNISTLKGVCWG